MLTRRQFLAGTAVAAVVGAAGVGAGAGAASVRSEKAYPKFYPIQPRYYEGMSVALSEQVGEKNLSLAVLDVIRADVMFFRSSVPLDPIEVLAPTLQEHPWAKEVRIRILPTDKFSCGGLRSETERSSLRTGRPLWTRVLPLNEYRYIPVDMTRAASDMASSVISLVSQDWVSNPNTDRYEIWERVGAGVDGLPTPGLVMIRNVKRPNSDTVHKEVVRFDAWKKGERTC